MSRSLLPGSMLNKVAGSTTRYPAFKVLVWNPLLVTINELASGTVTQAPLDLTPYVDKVTIEENIGYENATNPTPTKATISFRKNLVAGNFRRGWIDDGVLVRILEGDRRVQESDWIPIFTGTFRGRPGENRGMRVDKSEGLSSIAYGREERYISSSPVTTQVWPAGTDLGTIAYNIAWQYMGLGQDEILFGNLGYVTKSLTNQIVNALPLDALYSCFFPVGKKPKFDALGRLCAVDVNLDKPAARAFTNGDLLLESLVASPNDIEVNNQVILQGLDFNMTQVVQNPQSLDTVDLTTGFFDSSVRKSIWYSTDRTQRALGTYVVPTHRISWSDASWSAVDDFHGILLIDTHYLQDVRDIIFASYLAEQLLIASIDYTLQQDQATGIVGAVVTTLFSAEASVLAALRLSLQIASQVTLAALLWAMNYIGRGEYEIWGQPFELVYQQLVSDNRITGLDDWELRAYTYRNDFISDLPTLDQIGAQMLRREILKDQTYDIKILGDPLLEVDDILETSDGSRYYIVTASRTYQRGTVSEVTFSCWKVFDPITNVLEELASLGSGS